MEDNIYHNPDCEIIEKDFIFVGFVGVHIITNSQDVNIAQVSSSRFLCGQ